MEPSKQPDRQRDTFIPTVAVSAVAAMAIVAAVMVKRTEIPEQLTADARALPSASKGEVVTAPPLTAPDTKSMGAAAACTTCGVVQTVVAVYEQGRDAPRAYQMHIRMDDGSVRTVEQRGALAAGSRVKVNGGDVRPIS
jgi:hypothetical protein